MRNSDKLTIEEYNEEVFYCLDCHSLYIKTNDAFAGEDWDGSYCGKCGSCNIGKCKFGDWLTIEEEREKRRQIREWNR